MSIANVIGSLRCELGVPPESVQFFRPGDPHTFDTVGTANVGVSSVNVDSNVVVFDMSQYPNNRLVEILEARGRHAT